MRTHHFHKVYYFRIDILHRFEGLPFMYLFHQIGGFCQNRDHQHVKWPKIENSTRLIKQRCSKLAVKMLNGTDDEYGTES